MPRWEPVSKPKAVLTPVDPQPVPRDDGSTQQLYLTPFGKRYARVVTKDAVVHWFQEVAD